jgi:hypothetical protein
VEGIHLCIRLDDRCPDRLTVLPEGDAVPYQRHDGWLEFRAPRLETFLMIGLHYRKG